MLDLHRHVARKGGLPVGKSIQVHTIDLIDRLRPYWFVEIGLSGVTTVRQKRIGDVMVSAAASELLLMWWGRIPANHLPADGDVDIVRAWQDAYKL